MATPKAPPGGFQQGGWYDGMQYWNGSFSSPGQIHPESNQQGAGQMVSKEVVAQTNPANVAYLQGQGAKLPSSSDQVTPYLNDYQNKLFNQTNAPEVRVQTIEEIKQKLEPAGGAPAAISRVAERERMRGEMGVSSLEQTVNDLKAQEDEIVAQRRIRTQGEMDKPVALNVISGRVSEVERQENERLDAIGRQKSRAIDQLNTSYAIINQYVQDLGLDYGDAVQRYDSEFNKNLQMYDIIMKQESEARSEARENQKIASANLTTMMNLITSGNISYDAMSPDQKLMINKLEIQAGMPMGTMANLRMDADANIVFQNTNNGVTQIGIRNSDGSIRVESYGKNTSSSGGTGGYTAKQLESKVTDAIKILNSVDSQYRTINGKARNTYIDSDFKEKKYSGGDRLLSAQEADIALQQIIDSVGGNRALGEELFVQAFKGGNFSQWQ